VRVLKLRHASVDAVDAGLEEGAAVLTCLDEFRKGALVWFMLLLFGVSSVGFTQYGIVVL